VICSQTVGFTVQDDLKKSFGASVRNWRKRLGISQEELAERATLHRTYISDVERGARNVSLQSMQRLASALDTSLHSLFDGQSRSFSPSAEALVDILYVENEPDEVLVTMQAFKHARIANRIFVVREGLDALDFLFCTGRFVHRATVNRPQMVLLDLDLPRLGGLEVLQRIRKDPRTRSLPVVALCHAGDEQDMAASLRLGANACLDKPLDFQRLWKVVPQLNLQWVLQRVPARGPKE